MTTVQTMLNTRRTLCVTVAITLASAMLTACNQPKQRGRLEPPEVLVAPYDSVKGEPLWAVVPLVNESGVSVVDTLAMSDALVNRVTEVRGLSCLPMNRTIAGIRAMGNKPINSPAAARTLANILGVDGLLVGTITAYDPYDPPKLGMTLALFIRDTGREEQIIDPIRLQTAPTDQSRTMQTQFLEKPAAVVSEHYDSLNHEVQMDLKRYAMGRHDPDSAMGWRSGLVSMDLYSQFAAHQTLSRLLEAERLRLAQQTAAHPTQN